MRVRVLDGLHEVDADAWDALVDPDDPFTTHAFLGWLERSGSVGPGTGWSPRHLVVEDDTGLVGAAPLYRKDHSYGEFIFDWSWANAALRAGIRYYPKLVGMVPVTPATGRRLLVRPGADADAVRRTLVRGARELAERLGASGVHWLFAHPDEVPLLTDEGHHARLSHQYHWTRRPDWSTYDDFLDALTQKRRKEVRRERRLAASTGLALAVEPLATLSDDDLGVVHACYRATIDDHSGQPYLSGAWFRGLRDALGPLGLVATARRDGRLVAMALAFHRGRHLYGRYWGALEPAPALHFELCYHQLLAWGLERGVTRFEAGAQGEHKIPRGLLPSATHSAHHLRHPGLDRAIGAFVVDEAEEVRRWMESLAGQSPFRGADDAAG